MIEDGMRMKVQVVPPYWHQDEGGYARCEVHLSPSGQGATVAEVAPTPAGLYEVLWYGLAPAGTAYAVPIGHFVEYEQARRHVDFLLSQAVALL